MCSRLWSMHNQSATKVLSDLCFGMFCFYKRCVCLMATWDVKEENWYLGFKKLRPEGEGNTFGFINIPRLPNEPHTVFHFWESFITYSCLSWNYVGQAGLKITEICLSLPFQVLWLKACITLLVNEYWKDKNFFKNQFYMRKKNPIFEAKAQDPINEYNIRSFIYYPW